jgi:hypothetical protein
VEVLDPHRAGERDAAGVPQRDEAAAYIRGRWQRGVAAEPLDLPDAGDRLVAVFRSHVPPSENEGPNRTAN